MTPEIARLLVLQHGSIDRAAKDSGMPVMSFRAYCQTNDITAKSSTASLVGGDDEIRIRSQHALVYFVEASTGEIKIGIAVSPSKRLAELQTGSPAKLHLLAAIPGGVEREADLHAQFASARIHGEWFDGSIKAEVAALLAAHVASPNGAS